MSVPDLLQPIHFDSINTENDLLSDQTEQTQSSHMRVQSIHRITPSSSSLEHILLLDYDDTLIPTSYLLSNIDYSINKKTKRIETFTINKQLNETEKKQFISNLEQTGNAAIKFLSKIFEKFKASNIKIVTNGIAGWVPQSLFVASTFCPIYKNIQNIINQHEIEIIYARDANLEQIYWKTKCFDQILWQYFNGEHSSKYKNKRMNIVTVGDQWSDHASIKVCLTYHIYGHLINHHQIKLFPNPNCRYLCVELNYMSNLLDEGILFDFDSIIHDRQDEEGLVLEFDGYNDDNDNDNKKTS